MPIVVTTMSITAVSASTAKFTSTTKLPAGIHWYNVKWMPASGMVCAKSVW